MTRADASARPAVSPILDMLTVEKLEILRADGTTPHDLPEITGAQYLAVLRTGAVALYRPASAAGVQAGVHHDIRTDSTLSA